MIPTTLVASFPSFCSLLPIFEAFLAIGSLTSISLWKIVVVYHSCPDTIILRHWLFNNCLVVEVVEILLLFRWLVHVTYWLVLSHLFAKSTWMACGNASSNRHALTHAKVGALIHIGRTHRRCSIWRSCIDVLKMFFTYKMYQWVTFHFQSHLGGACE